MILIVGGAGYIGSHTNKLLNEKGYETVVYDNLVYGHVDAVKWGEFVLGDLNDLQQLRLVFSKYNITAVMHFAAYAYVGESVDNPEKYYENNVSNTLNVLKVMREFSCKYFVFSSTCATYGDPQYLPIDEVHPQNPINPYGQTKLMVEKILKDYSKAYDINYVSLRYFNASGADMDAEIGESHDPETHLIPLILDVALGKRDNIKVFGTDYDTEDGSAIRDYIHVTDLAEAHILAFEYLKNSGSSDVFNLGNGDGYSVLEVIDVVRKVTNAEINVILTERRSGDPAKLVGKPDKAHKTLGWKPKFFELEKIISSAWIWHTNRKY
jgi:UDP-glucose 4-epimerase